MVDIAVRVAINAIAFIVAVELVPRFRAPADILPLLLVAVVFGLINAYLKPIVKLLSLPLNLIAFGLVGLIVNTAMLLLLGLLSQQFNLDFAIAGWPNQAFSVEVIVYALIGAVVISIVSTVLALVKLVVPKI